MHFVFFSLFFVVVHAQCIVGMKRFVQRLFCRVIGANCKKIIVQATWITYKSLPTHYSQFTFSCLICGDSCMVYSLKVTPLPPTDQKLFFKIPICKITLKLFPAVFVVSSTFVSNFSKVFSKWFRYLHKFTLKFLKYLFGHLLVCSEIL